MGLNSRQLGGSRLDPDAKLYIAAVEAALGATIGSALPNASRDPKKIISDLYRAERDAGRYSLHKRIHLPIYANMSANSIDMVARAVGSFTGSGVTHGAGFVQGNGTTGYFNFNVAPPALGLSLESSMEFALVKAPPAAVTAAQVIVSSVNGTLTTQVLDLGVDTAGLRFAAHDNSVGAVTASLARTACVGIIIGSREGGSRRLHQRRSAFATLANVDGANAGVLPTVNFNAMRSTYGGGVAYYSGELGAYGAGLGMTIAQADGYSLNLKTLWENLTGLTLP
jgi:hypothetical protein